MLHLVTKQGCKPLPIQVDPRADVNTGSLSRYRTFFPNHFTPNGSLKPYTLRSTSCPWSTHNGESKPFIGFFTSEVQHKTQQDIIPITFYVFENSTRPFTLLSYLTSVHLGIVQFKVLNEACSHAVIDAITNTSKDKHVTFSTPLQTSTPITKKTTRKQKLMSILKSIQPSQDHSKIAPFQDHEVEEITLSQDNGHP